MQRLHTVALIAGISAIASAAAPAAAKDYASTALNIIPSGQLQLPGPDAARQAQMYNALTPKFSSVSTADLTKYFKPASLQPSAVTRTETIPGRPGVTIKRDPFDVPHIYGATDDDVVFGAGYVVAEDRNLLLQQARYNGLLAALDAPNLSAIALVAGLYQFTPSRQANDIVAEQTKEIERAGTKGRQLLHDIDTYNAGINAWLKANAPGTPPFTRNDIYSFNAIKGQFLGEGGGAEAPNSEFLDALDRKFGSSRGFDVFEDLRARNDPDTTTTLTKPAPYNPLPSSRKGVVQLRNGSYKPIDFLNPTAATALTKRHEASNILMVSGKRSRSGHPLFVGGPQIGYFFPGLTLEMGLHGPDIDTVGATSAPFPGYMLIGRGEDFAWTLTSADGDIVDTYAETLCGGSRTKYVYSGKCRAMRRVSAGTLTTPQGKKIDISFEETVHGPVWGYAKDASGRAVALARKRSSYGRDTLDQLFFQDLTFGRVRSFDDFKKAAAQTPQTFNSFYADDRTTGLFTTGLLPLRPNGADSDLPTDGRGAYEWRGFLPASRHPQGTTPSTDLLVNWNNKPAPGFSAGDNRFGGEGPVQRDENLLAELARTKTHNLASVVGAMNAAATEDVRGHIFWPTLKAMLDKGRAPSGRAREMVRLLDAWHGQRAPRLDRNGDGKLDDPGVAIMDGSWTRLADAAMCKRLGSALCDQLAGRMARFETPPSGQYGGWHQYMEKDLRTLLGQSVKRPYSERYCGKGKVSACASSLWQALDRSGAELAKQYGSSDPKRWLKPASSQQIVFGPLPLITMAYTNRSTGIQQVMEFSGHR